MTTSVPTGFSWPELDVLRRRTSYKWNYFPPDVLPLYVAELDATIATPIADAVRDALALGDTGYPTGTALAEAVADFSAERWGWRPDPARSVVTADVLDAVMEVVALLTAPGDPVVLSAPVYNAFFQRIAAAGRPVIQAPLGDDGRLDLDALDAAFSAARSAGRPAVHVMSNPHNPTGAAQTGAELAVVADLARRHGVRVVSDEIHGPLVLPGAAFVPYLSIPGTDDAFATTSASKAWHLAGLKAGLLIGGAATADDMARIPVHVPFGASHVGVVAHVAAFRHGIPWLDELVAALDVNRRLVGDLLAEHLPGVRYLVPEATYLAWLDFRPLGLPADPAAFFLERARVALSPGPSFGRGGEGHARLNFGTSPQILETAIRRMGEAVAQVR